jgi:hypothetical protein
VKRVKNAEFPQAEAAGNPRNSTDRRSPNALTKIMGPPI